MVPEIKKVLVIKLCCLGDIIQTTPALRAIRQGGAQVHMLCSRWVGELLPLVPFINKAHVMDTGNIFSVAFTLMKLRGEKFDAVLNLHRDKKSHIFASLAGASIRAGFSWRGSEKHLDKAVPFDPAMHESSRYLSAAAALGFPSAGEYTQIEAPLLALPGETAGKLKVGIFAAGGNNPGTTMPTKRWPAEKFNELIRILESKGAAIYAFGAKFDKSIVENAVKGTNATVVISGIGEFASYVKGLDAFVASDTGPLHIAAALGVKTIGIYGPSSPYIFGAKGRRSINIWEQASCPRSPCYEPMSVHKREFLECRDNICMKSIDARAVAKLILKDGGERP
jgi:ADP-heptose:LPS heptosyltransferase